MKTTCDETALRMGRFRPLLNRVKAVMTVCARPLSLRIMRRASSGVRGLPSSSPSIVTIVSAPRTQRPGRSAATALAFASESRRA